MPEEHHLYSALQAQTSPGIQTYRDALVSQVSSKVGGIARAPVWGANHSSIRSKISNERVFEILHSIVFFFFFFFLVLALYFSKTFVVRLVHWYACVMHGFESAF